MKKIMGLFKNKKVLIGVVVPLLVVGVAYKMFLAPKPAPVVKKVEGQIVGVGDPFTLNLAGGRYGRVTVSLVVAEGTIPVVAEGSTTAASLPQQDVIRSVITDHLTGVDASTLISTSGRHEVVEGLLKDLKKSTDEPVKEVLITDLAVQ
jgi:flagellar basal body-associated protein FliL